MKWGGSTSFLLSRHWTDYLVSLSLVQIEPGKIVLAFPFCWFDSRNIFNMNKTKVLLPIILEYGQEGTFVLTTVLLYAPKPPEIPADLLLLTCSPMTYCSLNDLLLPGAIEWGTSIGERENNPKKPPQNTDEKRGLRECFFFATCFLEHTKLESQHIEDRTATLPWSWQVATWPTPISPFCGDAHQKSLLIGGNGKNRYK